MNDKSTRKSFNRLMEDIEFQWYYFKNECRDLFNYELRRLKEYIKLKYSVTDKYCNERHEEIKEVFISEIAGDYAASIENYYGRNRFTLGIINVLTSIFNSTSILEPEEPLSEDTKDFISKISTMRILSIESDLNTYERLLSLILHDNI